MLDRQIILPGSANSCPLILLQTLLPFRATQPLWNQSNPHSFAKCRGMASAGLFGGHPGYGVPLRPLRALCVSAFSWPLFCARPLFSYSYELLFPQLSCFHNHAHCPGVMGKLSPIPHRLAQREKAKSIRTSQNGRRRPMLYFPVQCTETLFRERFGAKPSTPVNCCV
jgi:hypothetical protein